MERKPNPTISMKRRFNNRMDRFHAVCATFKNKYQIDRLRYDDSLRETADEHFLAESTVRRVLKEEPKDTYLSLKYTKDEMV